MSITDSADIEFEQTQGDSEGKEALRAAVRGVAKNRTQLSDWTTSTVMVVFFKLAENDKWIEFAQFLIFS